MADDRPSIKDEDAYEALRDTGYGKEAAARIANAQASDDQSSSKKGGKAQSYEEWTKEELMDRARELDVVGRSTMNKDELIEALRDK